MPTAAPRLPVPPPITSDVPGSWAYDTMSRRVRTDILARVFRENDFLPPTVERLHELEAELEKAVDTPLSFIEYDGGPDVETWNSEILVEAVKTGQTWLSAPWALSEFYLYRRIMTAIEYFKCPSDPFTLQKELGLTSAVDSIATLAERVKTTFNSFTKSSKDQTIKVFQSFVLTALWGNRMDLSIWPVGGTSATTSSSGSDARATDAFNSVLEAGQKQILSNDMETLSDYVRTLPRAPRMDIIADNAGFELFCDLCLADFLINSKLASVVYIQLKAHPTFVSDAMTKDVYRTIDFLCQKATPTGFETPESELGKRWASHIQNGSWVLIEDFFWVQPQAMWEMPMALRQSLEPSALTFVKGDANYRRLLGDRAWNFATPFDEIVCYFPTPVCALRTLKAELGCGMSSEATERAANEDPMWLVAGKFGVVQFCDTRQFA